MHPHISIWRHILRILAVMRIGSFLVAFLIADIAYSKGG